MTCCSVTNVPWRVESEARLRARSSGSLVPYCETRPSNSRNLAMADSVARYDALRDSPAPAANTASWRRAVRPLDEYSGIPWAKRYRAEVAEGAAERFANIPQLYSELPES